MPFCRVTLNADPGDAVRADLAVSLTALVAVELAKKPELTSVSVETSNGSWGIAGDFVYQAAHLEVIVTEGTNSEEHKRRPISKAHSRLENLLGNLGAACYVAIRKVPASN